MYISGLSILIITDANIYGHKLPFKILCIKGRTNYAYDAVDIVYYIIFHINISGEFFNNLIS